MNYQDKVYGIIEISEPVILDLINSPTLQRLKEIDQAGYSEPYFPGTSYTRFDHSVGVYWLLKSFNAPLEEQVAGLIHDVSHSAFSHCIDYVLGSSGNKQDHQDNVFEEFVRKSEIPEILKKHNFDVEYILDETNFPLQEKDLPDICADRIDYSLRTSSWHKDIENGSLFLKNLVAENGQWIFKNFEIAKKYADLFLHLNTDYYSSIYAALMFKTIADYLRYSLEKKYISEDDLYTTDKIVLDKIALHLKIDGHLSLLFDRLQNCVPYTNNPEDYEEKIVCKSRVVDPLCFDEGKIKRVSDIDPTWQEVIRANSKATEYFLKFEK